jgi:predicted DNA binding protein
MFTRYTVIPKGILEEMQRTVLKCFPDYKNNGYIEKRMSESDRYILQIIEMEITPDELEELAYQYRNGYFCIPKK